MLILRHHESSPGWGNARQHLAPQLQQLPANIYPQLPPDDILAQYQQSLKLDPHKFDQVIQFSKLSGLNFATSLDCLTQSQWNNDAAFILFQTHKPNIPASAYLA